MAKRLAERSFNGLEWPDGKKKGHSRMGNGPFAEKT
jgi:hypothetical protein